MSAESEPEVGLSAEERRHREGLQGEFRSDTRTCPECGTPVDNLRATCSKCGYEYAESEYDAPGAGREMVTGALVADDGSELTGAEDLERMVRDSD